MGSPGSGLFAGGFSLVGTDNNSSATGGVVDLNAYQNSDGNVIVYWSLSPLTENAGHYESFDWNVETDMVSTFNSAQYASYWYGHCEGGATSPAKINGWLHKGMVIPAYPRQDNAAAKMYIRVTGWYGGIWNGAGYDQSSGTSVANMGEGGFVLAPSIANATRQSMLDTQPDIIYKKDFAAGNIQVQSIIFSGNLVAGNKIQVTVNGKAVTFDPGGTTYTCLGIETEWTPHVRTRDLVSIGDAIVASSNGAVLSAGPRMLLPRQSASVGPTYSTTDIFIKAAVKDSPVYLTANTLVGGATTPAISIVLRNSTNLNNLYAAFGVEMDKLNMATIFADNDLYISSVRDSSLYNNFGYLMGLQRPSGISYIDFRELLRAMLADCHKTPSIGAVKRILRAIYGMDPGIVIGTDPLSKEKTTKITYIRDTQEMFVDDPASYRLITSGKTDMVDGNGKKLPYDWATTFGITYEPVPPFVVTYPQYPTSWPSNVKYHAEILAGDTWGDAELAFGVIININNPLEVPVDQDFVKNIISKILPAWAIAYVIF